MSSQDSTSNPAVLMDANSQHNATPDPASRPQPSADTQLSSELPDRSNTDRLAGEPSAPQPSSSSLSAAPQEARTSSTSAGASTAGTLPPQQQLPSSPISPTTSLHLRLAALEYLVRGANTAIPTSTSISPTTTTTSLSKADAAGPSASIPSDGTREAKIMDRISSIQEGISALTATNKPLRRFFRETFDELPPLTHTSLTTSTWTDEEKLHRLLSQLSPLPPQAAAAGSEAGSLSAGIAAQQMELKTTLDDLAHIERLVEDRRVLEAGMLRSLANKSEATSHQSRLRALQRRQSELDVEWATIQDELLSLVAQNHHQVNTTSQIFLALDEELLRLERRAARQANTTAAA